MLKVTFTSEDYTNLIKSRGNLSVYEILTKYNATFVDRIMSDEYPFNKVIKESYLTFNNEDDMILFSMKYM